MSGKVAVKSDHQPKKLYRIGEVSALTGVHPHVLRYWETVCQIVHPNRKLSKQRLYRQSDIELILEIKRLLYEEKYSLSGVKRHLARTYTSPGGALPGPRNAVPEPTSPKDRAGDLLCLVLTELKAIREILR